MRGSYICDFLSLDYSGKHKRVTLVQLSTSKMAYLFGWVLFWERRNHPRIMVSLFWPLPSTKSLEISMPWIQQYFRKKLTLVGKKKKEKRKKEKNVSTAVQGIKFPQRDFWARDRFQHNEMRESFNLTPPP